jgi:tetratricopeptide (TPR) repeat protein
MSPLARSARRLAVAAALAAALCGCKDKPTDHLRRARTLIYEKDPHGALREYRLALDALDRDEVKEAVVLRARALKGAADVYWLELRDVRQAIAVYQELIQQCPESPESLEAHLVVAELLRTRLGDLRGSITELSSAIARNPPQIAELTYQVAKLYFELGDYQQSALEAQRVVTRFETSGYVDDAMLLRGQALGIMEGRRDAARHAYEELIHRFPESELSPHARFELGKLAADAGENERAIAIWVEAVKDHPDPRVVQASIARVRNRIASTTPVRIGDHAAAFDHIKLGPPPKTSLEAVGGTAEEAARDTGD